MHESSYWLRYFREWGEENGKEEERERERDCEAENTEGEIEQYCEREGENAKAR